MKEFPIYFFSIDRKTKAKIYEVLEIVKGICETSELSLTFFPFFFSLFEDIYEKGSTQQYAKMNIKVKLREEKKNYDRILKRFQHF